VATLDTTAQPGGLTIGIDGFPLAVVGVDTAGTVFAVHFGNVRGIPFAHSR